MNSTTRPAADLSDRKNALVRHIPSGDVFLVTYASVWQGERCVGSTFVACTAALEQREWTLSLAPVVRPDWITWADDYLTNQDMYDLADNAQWANEEEEARGAEAFVYLAQG